MNSSQQEVVVEDAKMIGWIDGATSVLSLIWCTILNCAGLRFNFKSGYVLDWVFVVKYFYCTFNFLCLCWYRRLGCRRVSWSSVCLVLKLTLLKCTFIYLQLMKDDFKCDEDHSLMNGRLILSVIGVAFALYAVVWDYLHPFPESRSVLIVCSVSYFILSGLLTLYIMYKVSKLQNYDLMQHFVI